MRAPKMPKDIKRPTCRAECASVPRPCPFISCEHHLYLEVIKRPHGADLRFRFPHLYPWQMDPGASCLLDVADRGGITLDAVGVVLNITRERVRQIEVLGMRHIGMSKDQLGDEVDDDT